MNASLPPKARFENPGLFEGRRLRSLWVAVIVTLGGGIGILQVCQGAPPPKPSLEVIDNQTVRLVWDHQGDGFILQESDSPARSEIWYGVNHAPTALGAQREVIRSVPTELQRWFFRLRPRGPLSALDYLIASQNPSGLWEIGTGTSTRDTACAIEALELYGAGPNAVAHGASGLASSLPRNFDDLARRVAALAARGHDVQGDVSELLAGQNAAVNDPASLSYPGRGWGLAAGFGSSTLDSALVHSALRRGGLSSGLAVGSETIAGGASSTPHTFEVIGGATDVLLQVRTISGSSMQFVVNIPGSGGLITGPIAPGDAPVNVAFPSGPGGTWSMVARNVGTSAGTYSAELGYTDSGGFDSSRLTSPLLFIARTQNPDGGWGTFAGQDSHLMITAEVLTSLAGAGTSFVGPQIMSSAISWLLARQNGDGGFSSEPGTSNLGETVLAMNALKAANPSISLTSASTYLRNAQGHDGSWGSNPYLTAAAIKALAHPPVVSPIPGQIVSEPSLFASINLDGYVADPDHADNELSWTVSGNSVLSVSIVNRVASITYPAGATVSEALTFTATDPDGLQDSAVATFAVAVLPPVDFVIARNESVNDVRRFSGDEALLNQTASFTELPSGVPFGVTYLRTDFTRPTATEFEVAFQIFAGPAAPLGDHVFQVLYELHDEFPPSGPPLGPLTGNLFNFSIRITP